MTDKELIRGVIEREREAITCLVETYQRKVIKTAYYFLNNMEDAEDLAQDVFLEVVSSIGKFRQSSSLSTWIYRITVNRSLNAVRKNKRRQLVLGLGMSLSSIGIKENHQDKQVLGDHPMALEESRKLLNQAVNSLAENQRTAFILHKFEDLSYKEIAEVMDTSLSSVESLMHRARVNLQKRLAPHFLEYSKQK